MIGRGLWRGPGRRRWKEGWEGGRLLGGGGGRLKSRGKRKDSDSGSRAAGREMPKDQGEMGRIGLEPGPPGA